MKYIVKEQLQYSWANNIDDKKDMHLYHNALRIVLNGYEGEEISYDMNDQKEFDHIVKNYLDCRDGLPKIKKFVERLQQLKLIIRR